MAEPQTMPQSAPVRGATEAGTPVTPKKTASAEAEISLSPSAGKPEVAQGVKDASAKLTGESGGTAGSQTAVPVPPGPVFSWGGYVQALGILFLLLLDHVIPHLHRSIDQAEGPKSNLTRTAMLVLAVTLHNIPEGMAVGVVYAGFFNGSGSITAGGALALALGIAIQNFPEGAMPLYAEGKSKPKSFWLGVLSGAVEPVFGGLTVLLAALVLPAMPYLLAFAAGAMLYVVVEELIPEMSAGEHSNIGVISFAAGFSLMMALDVALG